jgi:uroporphyrinogen decarboxylase
MSSPQTISDGIHNMVPEEQMTPAACKLRDIYAMKPGAPLYHVEFGFMEGTFANWHKQGMPDETQVSHSELFMLDEPGDRGLGWCEGAFVPQWPDKVLEDRGEYELVQDFAGRHVLCFKNRRNGFMPEYVDHPVKDMRTWEENVKPRLNPDTPQRWADFDQRMEKAIAAAGRGMLISQRLAGAGMYLRSMIGPEGWLYAFYDQPELVHDCMQTWLTLADTVIARHQQHVTIDEIFFAEDVCYNHGPLIGHDTFKEFVFPYYQQLLANLKRRQLDQSRHLYVQIDTDGDCRPTIGWFAQALAMDVMSPFEVASGCDVVAIALEHPNLVMRGGIDKRVLAQGRRAIDEMVERIIPLMRQRGGYIPCCDHSVPNEVPYADYLYYRQRCVELGG